MPKPKPKASPPVADAGVPEAAPPPEDPPEPWEIFQASRQPHDGIATLPPPPPWRPFRSDSAPPRPIPPDDQLSAAMRHRALTFIATPTVRRLVNAALHLRRPLLITGKPGSGKSALVDAVAYELRLGEPLRWNVTSRSTLRDAQYLYDAVGRLQDQPGPASGGAPAVRPSIGPYLRLGPLGTALLPTDRPRALLIDEIDKADADLPNDLLNILEEGEYEIPELVRLAEVEPVVQVRPHHGAPGELVAIEGGRVRARQFPFVVFTSNGERGFSPAFLRRCLQLEMKDPTEPELLRIVENHLERYLTDDTRNAQAKQRVKDFAERARKESLATDQLLNAVLLVTGTEGVPEERRNELMRLLTQPLG